MPISNQPIPVFNRTAGFGPDARIGGLRVSDPFIWRPYTEAEIQRNVGASRSSSRGEAGKIESLIRGVPEWD